MPALLLLLLLLVDMLTLMMFLLMVKMIGSCSLAHPSTAPRVLLVLRAVRRRVVDTSSPLQGRHVVQRPHPASNLNAGADLEKNLLAKMISVVEDNSTHAHV